MAEKGNVFVALSGGVDSAVAAAELIAQGYDVTGVFVKIWQPEFLECTWREDRLDAMRVAVALGIPFAEVDLSAEYKREVVDDMLAKYKVGRTPNPDVLCNRYIKFGALWEWARGQGADYIATGHHARVECKPQTAKTKAAQVRCQLLRGVDAGKDQAYFLWQLTRADLAHTLLPVGSMSKREVRARADALRLPVAEKPDSQGLCFVGDIDMPTFLTRFIQTEPGEVIDTNGTCIGRHDGAVLYTLGQRRGLYLTRQDAHAKPHYVVAIDVARNILTASTNPNDAARTLVCLTDVHWITSTPATGTSLAGEVRYHQKPQPCTLAYEGDTWCAHFKTPQIVAPGQSVVLYDGEVCLGGGVAM